MSGIEDLFSQIPIDQVASILGVTEDEAAESVRLALPALVGGMAANAADPSGAASLTEALDQHSNGDDSYDLSGVDADDGEKIVSHVFGDQRDAVVDSLSGQSAMAGLSAGMLLKLLPLLAPLVLKFLSKMFRDGGLGGLGGGQATSASDSTESGNSGGGGVGGDIGSTFDDMSTDVPAPSTDGSPWPAPTTQQGVPSDTAQETAQDAGQGGGGLSDILGGLLGGKGGGITDILGGLLGQGRR